MQKHTRTIILLSSLAGLLGLISALAGLFLPGGDGSFQFTSVHGQVIVMYGRGLYANDPAFSAPIFRGTDLVTGFVGVPLLAVTLVFVGRGSLKARIVLLGLLAYLLYNAVSYAVGVTYNLLFPVYIVYFSASLYAFILTFGSLDLPGLAASVNRRMPHGGIAGFLFFAGVALLIVWGMDIVMGMAAGETPAIVLSYTTLATHALDMAIISPALFLSGVLMLRRSPMGYPLAALLLVMCSLIGLVVAGQTVAQTMDGVVLTPLEWAAKVAPFLLMALISGWLASRFFRGLDQA